jgi:hypothetical protein
MKEKKTTGLKLLDMAHHALGTIELRKQSMSGVHSDGFTMCRPMVHEFLNIEINCEGRIHKMKTKTFGEIGASSLNTFGRALNDWISWNDFIIFRPKVQGHNAFLIFMYTAAFFFFNFVISELWQIFHFLGIYFKISPQIK